ncbi:MAG: acylphosphatase [Chloroflexota bacterium]|nr:acylphosphatase [Chloroflexota bacterium]
MSGQTQQENEKAQLRAVVHGEVQGVGFRYWTRRQARELGLTGYVRNRWDGTVKVVAEGQRASLQRLLRRLGRGPRSAQVQRISSEWGLYTGKFDSFEIRF